MKKQNKESRFQNLMRRGTEALQRGEAATAMPLFERANQLQPQNKDVMLNLSSAYILSKKFKKAIEVLNTLIELDADNEMVWTNLGAASLGNPILAKADDQERAISAFKKALELNPNSPHAAYNIGLIYRDRKDFSKALTWFERAQKTDPDDKDAEFYIAQMKKQIEQQGNS